MPRGPKLRNPMGGGLPASGPLPKKALSKMRGKRRRRMGGAI